MARKYIDLLRTANDRLHSDVNNNIQKYWKKVKNAINFSREHIGYTRIGPAKDKPLRKYVRENIMLQIAK